MTPRRTLRIARWEAARGAGSIDRRTAALLVATLLVLAALAPAVVAYAPAPGRGVYRVAVSDANPYHAPVAQNAQLRAVSPTSGAVASGRADVAIRGGRVVVADSKKGRAALGTLRHAITAYDDRLMATQSDRAAAFPVTVSVTYVERAPPTGRSGGTGAAKAGTTSGAGGQSSGGGGSTTTTIAGSAGSGGSGSGASSGTDVGATGLPSTGKTTGGPTTPGDISPPFPLRSLLLAFAFLLPLNVVIQSYGSSVVDERIDRRGEPLLVSPATRGDVVVGKALPYFLGAVGLAAVVSVAVGAGPVSVLAVLPLAALFLGATFLGGLFARSYKELTFVTVAISIALTAYAFVPAVFTEVHPIAAISPLSVVVRDVRGDPIGLGGFALSTVPPGTAAVVCYALGIGVYREEDLFTHKPLLAKARDALAAPLDAPWRVGLWSALFVPFVLVAELFSVAALFVVPNGLAVPVVLVLVGVIEETAKSVHVFAGFENGRFPGTDRAALAVGVASGVGFFLAEKLLLLARLVDLPNLAVGRAAFGGVELGLGSGALLLLAPLALHVGAASISSLGARRSRAWYALALAVAIGVHVAYDYGVVSLLG